MNRDRLEWHLGNWRDYMKTPDEKLGYPSKSSVFLTGQDSVEDVFEILCDEVDGAAARAINGIIESLRKPHQDAVYHQWLSVKHCWPTHEYDLECAYESIMTMADHRGVV